MARRGLKSEEETLRILVKEEAERDIEETARRLAAIERFRGSIPNNPTEPTDWQREKAWVNEGMTH